MKDRGGKKERQGKQRGQKEKEKEGKEKILRNADREISDFSRECEISRIKREEGKKDINKEESERKKGNFFES